MFAQKPRNLTSDKKSLNITYKDDDYLTYGDNKERKTLGVGDVGNTSSIKQKTFKH